MVTKNVRKHIAGFLCGIAVAAATAISGPIEEGIAALTAQNPAKAEVLFRQALTANPDSLEAQLGLGLALLHRNRVRAAIEVLEKAERQAPDDVNVVYALGKAYWAARRDRAASTRFERVQRLAPDRSDLGMFLGASYLRQGRAADALKQLETAPGSSTDMRATKTVLEGVALSRLGRNSEAADRFRAAAQMVPGSPVARTADKFQGIIEGPAYGPRFRGSIRTGLQYDDNATLVPSRNVFNLRNEEHNTWGMVFDMNLAYDLLLRPDFQLTADYSFFQTANFSFDNADLHNHALKLHGAYTNAESFDIPYQLGLQVGADYLTVAADSLLLRGMVLPYIAFLETPWTSTMLVGRIQERNFLGQGRLDQTRDDRDATNWFLGITQRFNLPKHGLSLWLGYLRDGDAAEGRNWDYNGHIWHTGAQWQLPVLNLTASSVFQYHDRNYPRPHSFFGTRRSDKEYTVSFNLRCPVRENMSVYAEYLRDRNDSDLAVYDYSRDLYTLGIDYRF